MGTRRNLASIRNTPRTTYPVGIPDANECGIGVYLTVDESEIAEDFCLDLEIAPR